MNSEIQKISITPTHAKIEKKVKTLEGVVEVSFAPMQVQSKRPRLNLAIAIDASGSMNVQSGGAPAIEHAKEATLQLLERLDADDRVAIVAYATHPYVLIESMPVSSAREIARQALQSLHAMGSTALHAGWLTAAQQAAPHAGDYDISRVLLLSDGQATDGVRDEGQLAAEAEKLCAAGISTSTYGLGMNFNERLMTGMAVGGVARYAETADVLVPYFDADFSMLAQTVAKSVHVQLNAFDQKTGEKIECMLLGGGQIENDRWRLSPGIAGAISWAAFSVVADHGHDIRLHATWNIVDMEGQSHALTCETTVKRGKGAVNEAAAARINEVKAAKAAADAAAAARMGDRNGVLRHLDAFRHLSGNSAYAGAVSRNLDALAASGNLAAVAKETLYTSSTMSSRVVDVQEKHDVMTNDRFGLRKAVQGKNDDNLGVKP